MNTHSHKAKGDSILEILLAMAMFMIVLPAIMIGMASFAGGQVEKNTYFDALVLAEETKNVIQQIKARDWSVFANEGDYAIAYVGQEPTLIAISTTPTPDSRGYSSYITLSNVQRINGEIVLEGGQYDGATKKVTTIIDWEQNPKPVVAEMYVTRTDNIQSVVVTTENDFAKGGEIYNGTDATGTAGDDPDGQVSVSNGEIDPEISLKSWWKMSGEYASLNAEVDAAPNGINNLQIVGTPTFGQGRFGNKVLLDLPTKYLVASSSATLELSGQISIVSWIRIIGSPTESPIVYKKLGNAGYELGIDASGFVQASIGTGTTAVMAKNTATNINDNLWHQVALAYDGSTLKVYVDGVVGGQTGTAVGALGVNTKPLYIGKNPNSINTRFPGDIDDVQIYNTALTDDEIDNMRYTTYVSPPIILTTSALVHSVGATISQPEGTNVDMQVAVAPPQAGSCTGVSYQFVGPDGTEDTYFKTESEGESFVTGLVAEQTVGGFSNPGGCLRWRARFLSPHTYGVNNPAIKDVRFIYSL